MQGKGWHGESRRHSLASKGIKTAVKDNPEARIKVSKSKHPVVTSGNLVDYIMDYESGNPTYEEFFALFGYLIKTGRAWTLQGMYGRQARDLIDSGYIDTKGNVDWDNIPNPKARLYGDTALG